MSLSDGALYEFGNFRLDAVSRRLLRDGQIVTLTPKVFDLLLVLVERRGHVVSKEELLKAVWPDTFVEEGNLTQNISVLRKVLGAAGTAEEYIATVPRQGYRFCAPVRAAESSSDEMITLNHTQTRVVIEEETSSSWWRLGVLFGALMLALG